VTTMPDSLTCVGSRRAARLTRFCTSTAAFSRSRLGSKAMLMVLVPSLLLDELMYRMPSTPLISCSSGMVTLFSTTSELAPT